MALTDPTSTTITDLNTSTTTYTAGSEPWNKNLTGYNIFPKPIESIVYICDFNKWHGSYRQIPELRSTIDTECRWIIGKEIKAKNKTTQDAMNRIKGNGKSTFRKVLLNQKRTSKFAGDSFAEIVRDSAGRITNLKSLNPGLIKIEADNYGIIQRYVQLNPLSNEKPIIWLPNEIFHLMNDPIADEIHGIPEAEKLLDIIKMKHQAMSDTSVIIHRYGKPTMFYEVNTDDDTEIALITSKLNDASNKFENIVTPKGTFEKIDRVSIPQYSSIDTIPWHSFLRSYFTESSGVPDLVRGKSDEVSLAAGKLNFLSFKEKIIFQQLELQEEIKMQLGLEVEFETPREIDIEISRTEEDMQNKETAKRQKGGDQIVSDNLNNQDNTKK